LCSVLENAGKQKRLFVSGRPVRGITWWSLRPSWLGSFLPAIGVSTKWGLTHGITS
jgi:hypothetical protein